MARTISEPKRFVNIFLLQAKCCYLWVRWDAVIVPEQYLRDQIWGGLTIEVAFPGHFPPRRGILGRHVGGGLRPSRGNAVN